MGSSHSGKDKPHEAYQRRRIISNINIPIEKDIKCLTEYVQCPRGNVIYTKCYIPDSSIIAKPKGLICQCIGYTAYADYDFTLIAQKYCKQGYVYFIWDHYGHGRSSGLWADISNLQWLMDDTIFLCNYANKKYTLENNYLFGSSMGGNIVSRIIIQILKDKNSENINTNFISKNRWNGIILFAPMIGIDAAHLYHPLIMYFLENWLAYYFPKAILLPKTVGTDDKLSRDKEMDAFMLKDPLRFPFGTRPKTGIELLQSSIYVANNSSVIGLADIPLLVLHGTADSVTKSSMSLKLIENALKTQSVKDATHKLFKGAYHGLMVDECRHKCVELTADWMNKHNK